MSYLHITLLLIFHSLKLSSAVTSVKSTKCSSEPDGNTTWHILAEQTVDGETDRLTDRSSIYSNLCCSCTLRVNKLQS